MPWKKVSEFEDPSDEGGDHRQEHWDEIKRLELEKLRHGSSEEHSDGDRLFHIKFDHPDLFDDFVARYNDRIMDSHLGTQLRDLHDAAHRQESGSPYIDFMAPHSHNDSKAVEYARQLIRRINDHLRNFLHYSN